MEEKKISPLTNTMIWFGAGVSVAEILTGTFLAPLGFTNALKAILLGHLIGGILMFLVGYVGVKRKKGAMEGVKDTFGNKGGLFFSTLNILQLVGWTGVMILSGGIAANTIIYLGTPSTWMLIIGGLIILWIYLGFKNMSRLNIISVGALFITTVILSGVIFKNPFVGEISSTGMTFGQGVELSIAMPLSWLPLVADYTKNSSKENGKLSSLFISIVYNLVSSWMYIIGLGAALFMGNTDIAKILGMAGLGVVGFMIIILSTVTTTFLDVYSAGVSSTSIYKKLDEKKVGVIVTIVGVGLALFTKIDNMQDLLYLIGSVFAPMIAIDISNGYLIKKDYSYKSFMMPNLAIWIIGFILYRKFMTIDTIIGNTVPVIILVIIIHIIVSKVIELLNQRKSVILVKEEK